MYQANIYVEGKEFFSFKRVAAELGLVSKVPLVSLHSISKGEALWSPGPPRIRIQFQVQIGIHGCCDP